MAPAAKARRTIQAGAAPLSPQRKWRAITLATLLLVPGYWAIVAALVSLGAEDRRATPNAGPLIAFGLCLLPFVFIVLAFLSEHPNAPGASAKAMGMALLAQKADLHRLRQAITTLRHEEKEVFLLRQNGGLTYEQIAEIRHSPVGTVKTQMRAALQKLRKVLT